MHVQKRIVWKDKRWVVYSLFLLTIFATWLVRYTRLPDLLFLIGILLTILLFFASLIALQLSWYTPLAQQQRVMFPGEQHFPSAVQDLLRLSPAEFEAFIALVIEAMGYTQVQQIGGSGDLGADLLARNYFNLRIIVQCKRFAPDNQVTSPDLQRFLGSVVHYKAIEGRFVTTSTFTQPALDFAEMHSECIRLLNGEALVAFLQQRQRDISLIWRQQTTGVAYMSS